MSLPNNILYLATEPVTFLAPDHLVIKPLIDYERGGVAINDASEGTNAYNWKIAYTGSEVRLSREPYSDFTVLFTTPGITEIGFAFTQNMAVTVCYVQDGLTKLYWFDTQISQYVTTEFPSVTSPKLAMDDKREYSSSISDILFCYLRAGNLCYRQQRDRYNTERVIVATQATKIRRIGMTTGLRFAVELNIAG